MDAETPVQMEIANDGDGTLSTIGEVLASSKDALLEAAETITKLRLENEAITLRYATALVDLRRENVDLTNPHTISLSQAPSASISASTAAARVDVEAAKEIFELKRSVEKQQRLRTATEESLSRAKRKMVQDADLITNLQAEISELLELRVGTQRRLDMQVQSNVNLVRDAELRNSENIISSSREEFLENERQRLSAEILELTSKLSVVHSERVRESELAKSSTEKLRNEILSEKKENAAVNERCKLLQEEICSIQKHREKERDDAASENKHLMELISMHKEELKDVEMETARYKKLLDTFALDKLSGNGVPSGNGIGANGNNNSRALDSHAEALLKDLQNTLDQKLAQLNTQKLEMEEREHTERRLQIAFENEAREAEMAKRMARQLEDEKRVGEEENRNLRKKIRNLEEKILLAGNINIAVMSPRNNNNNNNSNMAVTPTGSGARRRPSLMR